MSLVVPLGCWIAKAVSVVVYAAAAADAAAAAATDAIINLSYKFATLIYTRWRKALVLFPTTYYCLYYG